MATFQNIVLIIATVILVISLCVIGLAMHRQKYNSTYPPVIANCPDYWTDLSGNGATCTNRTPTLGNTQCANTMNFTQPQWSGQSGLCSKYKWAKQCNLTWDGITNNAGICGT